MFKNPLQQFYACCLSLRVVDHHFWNLLDWNNNFSARNSAFFGWQHINVFMTNVFPYYASLALPWVKRWYQRLPLTMIYALRTTTTTTTTTTAQRETELSDPAGIFTRDPVVGVNLRGVSTMLLFKDAALFLKQTYIIWLFYTTGLMLGCSKHEEVSTGQCFLTKHRVWMRGSRDTILSHQEHSKESELWSTNLLLWHGKMWCSTGLWMVRLHCWDSLF